MKTIACALLALAAVALAGCHNSGSDQNSTDLRYVNAIIDAEPLDFLIDDGVQAGAVPVGTISSFGEFGSGTRDFKVRSSQSASVLVDKSIALSSGTHYTMLVYGKRAAINTLMLTDDTTSPSSSGNSKLRAVGLSPDVGLVDLYLTSGDIGSIPPAQSGIAYGTANDYVEFAAGSFKIVMAVAGTKDIVFQSAAQTFTAGTAYTVAVFPPFGGKLVNALLIVNGASATFLTNPLGRLKAVNAIPDSAPLNFKADGVTLLAAVPYTGSSTYVTTAAGARTLQLEASNVSGAIIASVALQVAAARDYTMLALGTIAQPQIATLADDNTAPASGFAKIRFVNAMNASSAVDVLVDFASQAAGINPGTASAYSTVAPKLDYVVSFTTPGGVSQLATLGPVELDAGGVYTAYLFGSAASPQARVVRDR